MGLLDLCEELFGKRNLYEVLEIEKSVLPKEIKKAYYKLSLQVHPDRVDENEKEKATEKFKILSKVYGILSDKNDRELYDEKGIVNEDDDDNSFASILEVWRTMFKKITDEDIGNYQRNYVGSELERRDMKKAYLSGKGCINTILNEVPFFNVEDEPRLHTIIDEMIAAGEVPEYKIFTKEPAQKRTRRHKKYAKEALEAEQIKKKLNEKSSLEQQIVARNSERKSAFGLMLENLEAKYGGIDNEDDSDEYEKVVKIKKNKKGPQKKNNIKKKPKIRRVKEGKIKKIV